MTAPENSDPTDDAPARALATRQFCLIYGLAAEIAAARAQQRAAALEADDVPSFRDAAHAPPNPRALTCV